MNLAKLGGRRCVRRRVIVKLGLSHHRVLAIGDLRNDEENAVQVHLFGAHAKGCACYCGCHDVVYTGLLHSVMLAAKSKSPQLIIAAHAASLESAFLAQSLASPTSDASFLSLTQKAICHGVLVV